MAVAVEANSPLAEQLTNLVQPKLVDMGWTTGGFDDSALTEYIILMLVNGKTQEQIATELSNDLLNLGPEDSGASLFAGWLFEQVNNLASGANGNLAAGDGSSWPAHEQATGIGVVSDGGQAQATDGGAQDADMDDAMDAVQGNIPTGPKSMRGNAQRGTARRMMGHINRSLDRSNDPMHRVRAQSGERINMHSRMAPRGPRGNMSQPRAMNNGIPTGPAKMGLPNRAPAPTGALDPQVLFRQQQQMMQMLQQFLPQGANGFQMPGGPAPVINPNFQNGGRGQGKSLFDRVEGRPNRHTRPFQNRNQGRPRLSPDTDMAGDTAMEVEGAGEDKKEQDPETTTCKFNLKCTKADCAFAHQSPAAPPGTTVDAGDHCPFGAACQNRKCTARHPSPAQKKMHQSEQDCKFFPHCTNVRCPFRHPAMPLCRNGAACTREGCRFTHVQTACKYNPCLNPVCPYKHEEGQKRGKFGDMVWRAPGKEGEEGDGREHVSERKFVADGEGPEELIVPGGQAEATGGSQGSHDADITVS